MQPHRVRWLGLASITAASSVCAQVVSYNFDADTLAPSAVAGTVTASSLSAGAGLGALTFAEGNPASGRAVSATSWTIGEFNPAANDYVEFSVAPKAGFKLTLTGVELDSRRSATGPATWRLASSLDSFAAALGTASPGNGVWAANQNVALNGAFAGLDGAVTFRVYGYMAAGASGTLRLDNLEIFGAATPVPEPYELGLAVALGLAGFGWFRRGHANG